MNIAEHARRHLEWFEGVTAKAKTTMVGQILFSRGWTVSHTGGGCLAWEKMTADKRHFALITIHDDEESTDELGTDHRDPFTARWIGGIYRLDAEGQMDDGGSDVYKETVGIGNVATWCELRLSAENPMAVTHE